MARYGYPSDETPKVPTEAEAEASAPDEKGQRTGAHDFEDLKSQAGGDAETAGKHQQQMQFTTKTVQIMKRAFWGEGTRRKSLQLLRSQFNAYATAVAVAIRCQGGQCLKQALIV